MIFRLDCRRLPRLHVLDWGKGVELGGRCPGKLGPGLDCIQHWIGLKD